MDSPLPDTAAEAADSQPTTDGPMGLAAVPCSACSRLFVPFKMPLAGTLTKCCATCMMKRLHDLVCEVDEEEIEAAIKEAESRPPTPEQQESFKRIRDRIDDMLVKAKAGKWVTTHDGYTEPRFEPNNILNLVVCGILN